MRIAFTHNVKRSDGEHEAEFDTPETIAAITGALRSLGHEVHPVDVGGPASRLVARLETLRPDLVFNTAEGSHGRYREAFYPALFEHLQLPFTGSGAYACGITLDKQATKWMLQRAEVPTPGWRLLTAPPEPGQLDGLRFPVIVKPNFEGSSKGVTPESIARDADALAATIARMLPRYPTGLLVEEFVVGRDVTVPWLETVGVLTPAAYRFDVAESAPGFAIYDYALKNEDSDRVHVDVPAPYPPEVLERLRHYTRTVMEELEIRDLGRADFRVTDDGKIYFIEVNALPSLEPGASIYVAAAERGLATEGEVLAAVLESAMARQEVQPRPARDGSSLRVGLAHNLRRVDAKSGDDADAEFDTPATVQAIADAIDGLGHEVVLVEATPELPRVLGDLELDVVFNIAEGLRGRTREAQVPALLDLLGIEFTGSDAAALAITLDKGLAKRLVRAAGVATPDWWIVPPGQPAPDGVPLPAIVKPNAEGSSKGVSNASVVTAPADLATAVERLHARYGSAALIEAFLPGREFTVGLLGELAPRVLPIMEIGFPEDEALPVYSYEKKTEEDLGVKFTVPAKLDGALEERVREAALQCFEALGCRDVARVDFRLDAQGVPNFIECNPLPGLSPGYSDLCVIAQAAGMDHAALVAAILSPAVRRVKNARVARATGADA